MPTSIKTLTDDALGLYIKNRKDEIYNRNILISFLTKKHVCPFSGCMLDGPRGKISSHILIDNKPNQVKYCEHAQGAGHLEEVDPPRVAQGKDEDNGAAGHGEFSCEVPQVAEVVAVQRGDDSVKLISDLKLKILFLFEFAQKQLISGLFINDSHPLHDVI